MPRYIDPLPHTPVTDPASLIEFKRKLADEIVRTLESQNLSVRQAERKTGLPAADFSRLRGRQLTRFSVDRLLSTLLRLDRHVELAIRPLAPRLPSPVAALPGPCPGP